MNSGNQPSNKQNKQSIARNKFKQPTIKQAKHTELN